MHLIFEGPPETINQLLNEPGGHRLQRTPPSERRGRVHTSTITVAVLPVSNENLPASFRLADPDISVEWFSGTGAGGQHRNKHQNSVRLTHLPSVITETSQQRSREASYKDALQRLTQRVAEREASLLSGVRAGVRKTQVGSGMRGDKIRTYRFQDDTAHDHQSGKKASLERVMAGHFELLWR